MEIHAYSRNGKVVGVVQVEASTKAGQRWTKYTNFKPTGRR
jgi:hypothetical protein